MKNLFKKTPKDSSKSSRFNLRRPKAIENESSHGPSRDVPQTTIAEPDNQEFLLDPASQIPNLSAACPSVELPIRPLEQSSVGLLEVAKTVQPTENTAEAPLSTSIEILKTEPEFPSVIDLWQRAYNTLLEDTETKALVESYQKILQSMPVDAIEIKHAENPEEQMSAVVDKKMKYFTSQQWKASIFGKEYNIREKIESIVKIIQVVKDFGSTVAGLDPIHAGLPWAGVCVLLTIISSDSQQHTDAVNGLKEVADMIPRYTAFENSLKKEAQNPENAELQEVPIDDWTGILTKVKSAADDCDKSVNALNWQGLKETVERQARDFKEGLQNLQQIEWEKENILSWVSNVPNQDDYEFILKKKLGESNWNSGQWLLTDPYFMDWAKAESGVFWLRGSVGTGKSCLTSLVIRKLLDGESPERLAYFYCSRDTSRPSRTDAKDILRSILAQLLYSRVDLIRGEYKIRKQRNGTLQLEDCPKLLSELINSAGSCTVIIDALDECGNSYDLMGALKKVSDSTKLLKIFVSSRLEDRVTADFPERLCTTITSAENQKDINNFIEVEIKRRRTEINRRNRDEPEQMSDELAGELNNILKTRAQSMFRWVELQLDLFLSLDHPSLHHDTIEEQLATLRKSDTIRKLDDVYDQVYQRNTIEKNYGKLAVKALQWVLASFRPLHIDELREAVAIKVDFKQDSSVTKATLLNKMCSNFITTDKNDMVQFAHLSVREYLEKRRTQNYSPLAAHAQAAESCLAFIQQPGFNFKTISNDETEGRFPRYATLYWPYHCELASENRTDEILKKIFNKFVGKRSPQFLKWFEELPRIRNVTSYYQDDLIKDTLKLRAVESDPKSFFLGCCFGFHEILVASALDLNARTVYLSERGVTGLIIASAEGHQKVVKLLLDAGAGLNVSDEKGHTALYHAAENGHEMVVRLLLEAEADIEAKDLDGRTALHRAATNGHEAVVKLLIDCEAINIEAKDSNYGWTPLFWAADNGHESVVQLLLEKGANIKVVDERGWTPLYGAAANGFETVVELLLDCEGIDIEPKDARYGWTPLSWAVENGHEPVVRLLIERGADFQAKDKNGWTALYGAAMNGHEAVVQLLLENGADVNTNDLDGRTVLQRLTAENRQNRAVSLLREVGDDVDVRNDSGTTLKSAVAKEKRAAMWVQADKGSADPSSLLSPPDTASRAFGNRTPSLFQFRYSACNGRRKALLIGINYFGQSAQLTDSIDDVKNMSAFLVEQYKYPRENIIILTDDENSTVQPTKQNILKAMKSLVEDALPNDSLFFHFSGYGGQTRNLDGYSDDGYDEVIYPVDYKVAGDIVDVDMYAIMFSNLLPGVRLTAIFDSRNCTAVELHYIYTTQGILREPNLRNFDKNRYPSRLKDGLRSQMSPADVITWIRSKGKVGQSFIRALTGQPQQSYTQLMQSMRRYKEQPLLSCNHPLDLNALFIM